MSAVHTFPSDVVWDLIEGLVEGGPTFKYWEYRNRKDALLFLEELRSVIPYLQETEKGIKAGLRRIKNRDGELGDFVYIRQGEI